MEFNNQEELMQAAADVYSTVETIYKGSEINADTLYSTAKNHFDFTDAQLNQLSDYFQKEEQEFWGLEDDSLEEVKTKYDFIVALSNKTIKDLIEDEAYDAYIYEVIDKENGGIKFGPNINLALRFNEKYDANEIAGIVKEKGDWGSVVVLAVKQKSLEEAKLEENEPNKITYKELKEIFTNINKNKEPDKYGVIVFTEDSFTKPYSLESRSYKVSSDNKVFKPDALGYSLYGSALDGSDDGVRLESYMKEEQGGSNGWKVDYCYILDNEKEVE